MVDNIIRRTIFRWLLQFYEDKDGLFWKLTGLLIYGFYKVVLDYDNWKYNRYLDNIHMERGQLELLRTILESK